MKKKKNARHWCLQSSRKCLQLYLSFFTAFYERKNLHDIGNPNSCWKLHRTIIVNQLLISWETYLNVKVCVDCFKSLKESESVQLMIHEVLTSEIKSHSLPGVATIISGHLFKSLCCFWGAIPPTTATILKKRNCLLIQIILRYFVWWVFLQ